MAKKILIIKTHAIGDVLMATPAIRALKTSFPQAEISVLIGKWSAPILKNNSYITRLIEIQDAIIHKKQIINIIKLIIHLRAYEFDTALVFHPSPIFHCIAALAGIKKRYGLSRKKKSFFLTASTRMDTSYDVYFPFNFLQVLGLLGISSTDIKMDVFSTQNDLAATRKLLSKNGVGGNEALILIAPGGSFNPREKIAARVWPVDCYIQLIKMITRQWPDYRIILSGGSNDSAITALIKDTVSQVFDLAGKTTIQELICLVGMSKTIICNDSSVLHIGIAQNKPTIGIFGPTSLKSRVPLTNQHYCIQSPSSCSPCYRRGVFSGCKNGYSCMREITPEQVFLKARSIVQK